MRKLLHLCALLGLAALPASAARTVIQDTLFRANGGTCSGYLAIYWQTFVSVSNQLIQGGSLQSKVINGVVNVSLEPGTYRIEYQIGPVACTPTTEFWVVPISLTPLAIANVRTITTPTSTAVMNFAQLPNCNGGVEGAIRAIRDSTTNTWGAVAAGGGTNHVLVYCDSAAWTVAGM